MTVSLPCGHGDGTASAGTVTRMGVSGKAAQESGTPILRGAEALAGERWIRPFREAALAYVSDLPDAAAHHLYLSSIGAPLHVEPESHWPDAPFHHGHLVQ